jgi:hypothetical protein
MTILQYIDPAILAMVLFFSLGFALGVVVELNVDNKKLKKEKTFLKQNYGCNQEDKQMAFTSSEAVVLEICDRVAHDTGKNLGEHHKTDFTKMISNLIMDYRQSTIEVLSDSIKLLEETKNYAIANLDESSIIAADTQLITMKMALELVRLAYRET